MEVSDNMTGIVIVLSLLVILPIVVVWLVTRLRANETNRRTEIILKALEQNPDMDVEQFIKQLTPAKKGKTIKERLLGKLLGGCTLLTIGIVMVGHWGLRTAGLIVSTAHNNNALVFGSFFIGIGIALIIQFVIGKRWLAKEIEQEQNQN